MSNRALIRPFAGLLTVWAFSVSVPAYAEWGRGFGPSNEIAELEASIQQFKDAERGALASPSGISDYVQAGLTMSNVSCNAWLMELGKSDRDTGFFKNMLNIVGNLILGISGINGASPSSLARGSIALGASNATIDAFRHDFLMGVVSDIETKVKAGRKISEQMLLEAIPSNHQEAKRRLLEYHDQCTPTAIKELLKTSLANVAYVRPDSTLEREVNEARASMLAVELYGVMFPTASRLPYLTSDDLYKLWIVKMALPSEHPKVKGYQNAEDVAAIREAFDTAKSAGRQPALLLKQIAELRHYAKRLADELAKEKQEAAGAQEAKAQLELQTAMNAARRSEDAVNASRAELREFEKRLALAEKSSAEKAKKESQKLRQLIQESLDKSEHKDVKPVANQVPDGESSQNVSELRALLSKLADSLDARDRARSDEQSAQEGWTRAVATRRAALVADRPVSITPLIVPLNQSLRP